MTANNAPQAANSAAGVRDHSGYGQPYDQHVFDPVRQADGATTG